MDITFDGSVAVDTFVAALIYRNYAGRLLQDLHVRGWGAEGGKAHNLLTRGRQSLFTHLWAVTNALCQT